MSETRGRDEGLDGAQGAAGETPATAGHARRSHETFRVEGHTSAQLHVWPGLNRCGSINDGIAFEHGDEGAWVVAFEDLLMMARLAAEERGRVAHESLMAELVGVLRDCVSALDKLMGDSDIEGDTSPEFVACQRAWAAIAKAEGRADAARRATGGVHGDV